jgi:hypothetical protein
MKSREEFKMYCDEFLKREIGSLGASNSQIVCPR